MFINILKEIEQELSQYKRDKKNLLPMYIEERLQMSLKSYYKEIYDSYSYLSSHNELKALRKINNN